jgi:hypothetical protein
MRLTQSESARDRKERTLVRVTARRIARSRDADARGHVLRAQSPPLDGKGAGVQLGLGGILVIIGIILIVLGHWILGIILALIGLVFFGGFARGRWY